MTKTISAVAMVLAICLLASATPKANFGGAWVMDRGQVSGIPRDLEATMTVAQAGRSDRELRTKLIQTGSERTVKDTFILDGKEREFNPPAPLNAPANAPPPKGETNSCLASGWQKEFC